MRPGATVKPLQTGMITFYCRAIPFQDELAQSKKNKTSSTDLRKHNLLVLIRYDRMLLEMGFVEG